MIDRSTEGYEAVATRLEAVLNPERETIPEKEEIDFLGIIAETAQEIISLLHKWEKGPFQNAGYRAFFHEELLEDLDEVAALSFSMANIATSLKTKEVKR